MADGIGTFALKGRAYDAVKYTVLIGIPTLSTGYVMLDAALDSVGGVPYDDVVVKVLAVVAFVLGTLTGISKLQYNNSDARFDGTAFVDRLDPTNNPDVMLKDPNFAKAPKELRLKVAETAPPSSAEPVGEATLYQDPENEPDTPLEGLENEDKA